MFNQLRSQSGNAILYALIIVPVVMTASLYGLKTVGDSFDRREGVVFEHAAIQTISEQLRAVVENEASWAATIAANPTMACLLNNNVQCPIGPQPISIRIDAATVMTTSVGPEGFTRMGFLCNSYNALTPDGRCTYTVRATWQPVCVAPCLSAKTVTEPFAKTPPQRVNLNFSFSSSQDSIAGQRSIASTDLVFTRGADQAAVHVFCETIPGQLVGGGLSCRFDYTPKNCVASEGLHMVDRVTNSGNVLCTNPSFFGSAALDRKCSPGNAMTGISGGGFVCDVF